MRIVFAGSGSGGHFYPNMAIAEALREQATLTERDTPELFLLGPDPYDTNTLYEQGVTFKYVPAGKVRRYFSWRNFLDAFKTLGGIFVALWHLFILYPDVVMSKGSYTSVPVVIAAWFLRIPVVVHESDIAFGRANALAEKFAHTVAVSYETMLKDYSRAVRTGVPMRKDLLPPYEGEAYATLGIPKDLPVVLVLGGSQGAERINNLIVSALDELLPKYRVLHQTGEAHADFVQKSAEALVRSQSLLDRYHPRGYFDEDSMAAAYAVASIIISRAGSTIFEIAAHGTPAILIPIPETVGHDQRRNAYEYARSGAASVLEEKNLSPHVLASTVERIMGDERGRREMSEAAKNFAPTDAADRLAATLIQIADQHA